MANSKGEYNINSVPIYDWDFHTVNNKDEKAKKIYDAFNWTVLGNSTSTFYPTYYKGMSNVEFKNTVSTISPYSNFIANSLITIPYYKFTKKNIQFLDAYSCMPLLQYDTSYDDLSSLSATNVPFTTFGPYEGPQHIYGTTSYTNYYIIHKDSQVKISKSLDFSSADSYYGNLLYFVIQAAGGGGGGCNADGWYHRGGGGGGSGSYVMGVLDTTKFTYTFDDSGKATSYLCITLGSNGQGGSTTGGTDFKANGTSAANSALEYVSTSSTTPTLLILLEGGKYGRCYDNGSWDIDIAGGSGGSCDTTTFENTGCGYIIIKSDGSTGGNGTQDSVDAGNGESVNSTEYSLNWLKNFSTTFNIYRSQDSYIFGGGTKGRGVGDTTNYAAYGGGGGGSVLTRTNSGILSGTTHYGYGGQGGYTWWPGLGQDSQKVAGDDGGLAVCYIGYPDTL